MLRPEPFFDAKLVNNSGWDAPVFKSNNGGWDLPTAPSEPYKPPKPPEIEEDNANLLDKDQFSAKLLKFADEKTAAGNFAHEAKDRVAILKLFAEVQGFIGKVNIDASQKTFNNNSMVITLVEAEQEAKVIENVPTEVAPLENALNVNLKLVG